MSSLQKMFPSLTLFSDLNWDQVTEEYQRDYADVSFPEYLQQKASDGDCPPYLFELAFYELAKSEVHQLKEETKDLKGVCLNPSALFLNLEFDVSRMIKEAELEQIEIVERPNILCIYLDHNDKAQEIELSQSDLEVLEHLEDGPATDKKFIKPNQEETFEKLKNLGIVIHNI